MPSEDDRVEPGRGMQLSKQCSLTFCRELLAVCSWRNEERGRAYSDQGAGIVHGGLLLQLLHDGGLDLLGVVGGRIVVGGAEEGHFVGGE